MSTTNKIPQKSWQQALEAAEEEDAQTQKPKLWQIHTLIDHHQELFSERMEQIKKLFMTDLDQQELASFRRAGVEAREILKARAPELDLTDVAGLPGLINLLLDKVLPRVEEPDELEKELAVFAYDAFTAKNTWGSGGLREFNPQAWLRVVRAIRNPSLATAPSMERVRRLWRHANPITPTPDETLTLEDIKPPAQQATSRSLWGAAATQEPTPFDTITQDMLAAIPKPTATQLNPFAGHGAADGFGGSDYFGGYRPDCDSSGNGIPDED